MPDSFDKDENGNTFAPKSDVARGAGGRFVSKKKDEPKESAESQKSTSKTAKTKTGSDDDKVYGPMMAPFAGHEVRKFYTDGKWYFALSDLYSLLSSPNSTLDSYSDAKTDSEFEELFKKNLRMMADVECTTAKGASEILLAVIKARGATFPGSMFRWLDDVSAQPYEAIKPLVSSGDVPVQSANPSDRGM